MISKEACGTMPHTGPPPQAPGTAIVPAAAAAARHDRPDRRIAVHPGTHLRGRVRHPPAALRVPRRAGHRTRRRRQHGLLRGPVRHREPDRTRQPVPVTRAQAPGGNSAHLPAATTLPVCRPADPLTLIRRQRNVEHMPGDPDAGGRFVRLDDGDMHVAEDGKPGTPALLLIHGTAASTAWWDPVIPRPAGACPRLRVDPPPPARAATPAA